MVSELNNNLSGGEIQRLSIARSLLKYPDLLIMDETTSGIQIEKEKIIENIKNFFPKLQLFLFHIEIKVLKFVMR